MNLKYMTFKIFEGNLLKIFEGKTYMSIGIVTPKVLAELTTKLCRSLGNKNDTQLPIHVSQKYSTPERMVLDMEKPRRIFTFCPPTPHNSDNIIESLCTQMGPLDVVIDCYIDNDTDISRRRDICEHNSTQYLSVNMTHAGMFVQGARGAYMENKNLLKKLNPKMYYLGPIKIV